MLARVMHPCNLLSKLYLSRERYVRLDVLVDAANLCDQLALGVLGFVYVIIHLGFFLFWVRTVSKSLCIQNLHNI